MIEVRNNWTKEEIKQIFHLPILELIFRASNIHNTFQTTGEVQVCTLLSVKTGGCPEDCAYCPQASRYHTKVESHKLLEYDEVITKALIAKENGSTRFCMGAAWRNIKDNKDFDQVLEMVKGVSNLNLEVCCTLGMLTDEQAKKLKDAGLFAYNHNLDTGESFYDQVISTRKYEDRLHTIEHIQNADISVCSGGIIGLGESEDDRIDMLYTLSNLKKHPESVPVNALVAIKGTPLENMQRVSVWEMIRMIATARILMPKAMVRLSAGRNEMSVEEQALCFIAGANSIFAGDKLLTTPNPEFNEDKKMFELLGLKSRAAYKEEKISAYMQ